MLRRLHRGKLPALFLLENVKGLLGHDSGRSFDRVLKRLESVGSNAYDIKFGILNTEQHGIPQQRVRLYLVGRLRTAVRSGFSFPLPIALQSIDVFLDSVEPCPSSAQQLDCFGTRYAGAVVGSAGADRPERRQPGHRHIRC